MDSARPLSFPALPPHPENDIWSGNVTRAHQLLSESYTRASQLLRQEDGDPLRLRIHSERIYRRMIPILEALQQDIADDEWTAECAHALAKIVVELEDAAFAAQGVEQAEIHRIVPVTIVRTGRRGRPRKVINQAWLENAMSSHRKLTISKLADLLGMHRNAVAKQLKVHGVDRRFSDISDHDIDLLIKLYKRHRPTSGLRYVIGFLKRHGLRVQKRRVRSSLRRIDGLGQVLRNHEAIDRREYKVPRPNYLWHMDGYHKLIRWGFVIHGMVDGYCRTIVGMEVNTNNRASTVLDLFMEGIGKYGLPSRVRGDRGGENIEVAVWMIKHRGPNRASFMWGSSTRNTRIERLWVEVGSQFARRWRAFFTRLERLHQLDHSNPTHLWLLQLLFLGYIREDCSDFQEEWNHHPISGEGHDQTPLDMRFVGQLQHGVYDNDYEDVHPDILNRYYGADLVQEAQHPGETGAGHSDLDDDPEDLEDLIAADQERHVRHDPIPVPESSSPFPEDITRDFMNALNELMDADVVPTGMGVRDEEWPEGEYQEVEAIRSGRKYVNIRLPYDPWWPRAVVWAKALVLLSQFQSLYDEQENGDSDSS